MTDGAYGCGLLGDEPLLALCLDEQRALLTNNVPDFVEIARTLDRATSPTGSTGYSTGPGDRESHLQPRRMPKAVTGRATEWQNYSYSASLQTMKTTVTITSRGVITLPAKLRKTLGLKADDQLIAETTPEGLLLRPAVTLPVEIYNEERVREFDEAESELAEVIRPRRGTRPRRASRSAKRRR